MLQLETRRGCNETCVAMAVQVATVPWLYTSLTVHMRLCHRLQSTANSRSVSDTTSNSCSTLGPWLPASLNVWSGRRYTGSGTSGGEARHAVGAVGHNGVGLAARADNTRCDKHPRAAATEHLHLCQSTVRSFLVTCCRWSR